MDNKRFLQEKALWKDVERLLSTRAIEAGSGVMPCGCAEKEMQVLTSVFRFVQRVDRVCAWFVAGG